MRLITYLTLLLLGFSSLALGGPLSREVEELVDFEELVSKSCSDRTKASSYAQVVQGKTLHCSDLIVLAHKKRTDMDKRLDEMKACEIAMPAEAQSLTGQVGKILKRTSCAPSPDRNQCIEKFGCSFLNAATAGPLHYIFKSAAAATGNSRMKACASESGGRVLSCISKFAQGIIDNIWGTIKSLGHLASMAWNKAGEFLGFYERETSRKNHLAQNANDRFLDSFLSHPIETLSKIASGIFNSIKNAAMANYACPKRLPSGECATPIPEWNCASCAQKSDVICGVAGYAMGEIGTSVITGGLFEGAIITGKGLARISKVPASKIGSVFAKEFPRSSELVSKGAQALVTATRTGLTKAQIAVITRLEKSAKSPAAQFIAKTYANESRNAAVAIVKIPPQAVGIYVKTLLRAGEFGGKVVSGSVARVTGVTARTTERAAASHVETPNTTRPKRSEIASDEELKVASGLNQTQREEMADRVLGRKLSDVEKTCLEKAHQVGISRGFGHYTRTDLISKKDILIGCGFNRTEVIDLMDKGIAGSYSDSLATLKKIDSYLESTASARGVTDDMIKAEFEVYKSQMRTTADNSFEVAQALSDPTAVAASWSHSAKAGDLAGVLKRIDYGVEIGMKPELVIQGLDGKLQGVIRMLNNPQNAKNPILLMERQIYDDALLQTHIKYQIPSHGGVSEGALKFAASPSRPAIPQALREKPTTVPYPKRSLDAPPVKIIAETQETKLFETILPNGKTQMRYTRKERNLQTGEYVDVTYDVPRNAINGAIDAKTEIGRAVLDDLVKAQGGNGTVVFIDANHLGKVNYMQGGTSTGDLYLESVAKSIRENLKSGDMIFNNGGDELVVVLNTKNPLDVKSITQRMSDAVSSNPQVREIFRKEVAGLSQTYKDVAKATRVEDLPIEMQEIARKDFSGFKKDMLDKQLKLIQEQSMYKGSISVGASFIGVGEELTPVLTRAEAVAAQVKANYKGKYGFDTAKYNVDQGAIQVARRGGPTALEPAPAGAAIVVKADPLPTPALNRSVSSAPVADRVIAQSANSKLFETNLSNGRSQMRYTRQEPHTSSGRNVDVTYDVPRNAINGAIDAKTEIGRAVLDDLVKAQGGNGTVVFIDANHLGKVNYMQGGTSTGDLYLESVAKSIRENLKSGDMIFNNGGDELVVVLNTKNPLDVKSITQRMSDAVSSNPQVREIFRKEVAGLSQTYKDVAKVSRIEDLPTKVRDFLTPELRDLAQRDFPQFKKSFLESHMEVMKEQSMYKGSISVGASFIRPGEELKAVLTRAEEVAAKVKSNYKAQYGFDTSKYKSDSSSIEIQRRGAPVALDPVP